MVKRARVFLFGLAALALSGTLGMEPGAAAPFSAGAISLSVLQPVGPRGQLTVTGFTVGKVLHTADGGQVFGFDLDQNGVDGLLGSAQTITPQGQVLASLETFDQLTAKITKTVITTRTMDDWVTEGIFAGDAGLVLHDHVVNNRNVRSFRTLTPVTSGTFTGTWTPPNGASFLLQQVATNQTTKTTAVLGSDVSDNPIVFSSNIAANTFGPVFHLDPNHFSGADQPQLAIDTALNEAVLATSPDAGAVGGQVPLIATVNLITGKMQQFNGIRIGIYHSGYVNGLGMDSATGIACTTTELDADVEFYDIVHLKAIALAALPGANQNQAFSGGVVVSDPLHKLFLIAQASGSIGPPGGSVIDIFDESGNLVKSIVGFKAFGVTPGMAINPAKRLGFIDGPTANALTQFTY
ncbi:MAG: hypothetical protein M3Z41_09165 [Candidatus Eremiobacteraeota bacterium]|nr:hypothetical protein [Candidatus Eremiobacteraeota bacterium]